MITAAQLMTPEVFVLSEEDHVREATHALLQRHLHGAPVRGANEDIVGVASLVDLARAMLYESARPDLRVSTVVSRPALTVPAGAGVYECARAMIGHDVHRLVVVDPEGQPIGILTQSDILRSMVNLEEGFRCRPVPVEREEERS